MDMRKKIGIGIMVLAISMVFVVYYTYFYNPYGFVGECTRFEQDAGLESYAVKWWEHKTTPDTLGQPYMGNFWNNKVFSLVNKKVDQTPDGQDAYEFTPTSTQKEITQWYYVNWKILKNVPKIDETYYIRMNAYVKYLNQVPPQKFAHGFLVYPTANFYNEYLNDMTADKWHWVSHVFPKRNRNDGSEQRIRYEFISMLKPNIVRLGSMSFEVFTKEPKIRTEPLLMAGLFWPILMLLIGVLLGAAGLFLHHMRKNNENSKYQKDLTYLLKFLIGAVIVALGYYIYQKQKKNSDGAWSLWILLLMLLLGLALGAAGVFLYLKWKARQTLGDEDDQFGVDMTDLTQDDSTSLYNQQSLKVPQLQGLKPSKPKQDPPKKKRQNKGFYDANLIYVPAIATIHRDEIGSKDFKK